MILQHLTDPQKVGFDAGVLGLGTYAAFLLKLLPAASLVLTIILLTLSIAVKCQEWRLNAAKSRGGDK